MHTAKPVSDRCREQFVERAGIITKRAKPDLTARVELEIPTERRAGFRDDQDMSGGHRLNAAEEGSLLAVAREELQHEVGHHQLVGCRVNPRDCEQSLCFRREQEGAVEARIAQRADAEPVACEEQPLALPVEQRESEVSLDALDTGLAVFKVSGANEDVIGTVSGEWPPG